MRFLSLLFFIPALVSGAGKTVSVEYPPSTAPGELIFGVTFTVWIPDGVQKIRGVIVHQHGCGEGACKGGRTAAYDLHWQELARKWDCALLGPSYQQPEKADCRKWCDPREGSVKAFLRALKELGEKSGHPELETAPWCLWGHSGGGFWASILQTMYPDRIVAIWFRSGTAYSEWTKGKIAKPDMPESMYKIPMVCNPGAKENGDKRFNGIWTSSIEMFNAYRAQGAPIAVAPDPRTGHECGDSRYMAIPFFDACLGMRLPDKGAEGSPLKPVESSKAWLAPLLGELAQPAAAFTGKSSEANWFPNEAVAKAWMDYVKTGAVADTTPPAAPTQLKAKPAADGAVELTWEAAADFESGLQQFIIERDGQPLGAVPEKPKGSFGRPLFQRMSFHDTPEEPMPEMKFIDKTAKAGEKHSYSIISVNSVGLKSDPAKVEVSQ
ncbi:MAG TPA: hypothetical protein VEK08_24435 [Planctomycetota bacterium]|nr:hypothetical protein [Planctomycetota bacterium]